MTSIPRGEAKADANGNSRREREPGYRCAAHRGGCTNRVDHPLTVCTPCLQAAGIELEAHDGREPDDFQKDWTLSEHGYGQEDYHDV